MFLVVLMPIACSALPVPRVRLLESGKRVGREIVGLKRTTRCWFEPGYIEAEVEVSTGAEVHRYPVIGPEVSATAKTGWLSRVRSLFSSGS